MVTESRVGCQQKVFTLKMSWTSAYKSSLRQLSTPSLYGEMLKLENSIKHLRRSNGELRIHGSNDEGDTSWIQPVIAENELVIMKQNEQVELVKQEISDRGAKSEHEEEGLLSQGPVNDTLDGNEQQHYDQEGIDDRDRIELEEPSNGVHL
jgi:hypothetical protein